MLIKREYVFSDLKNGDSNNFSNNIKGADKLEMGLIYIYIYIGLTI